jgi:hypothetical protein
MAPLFQAFKVSFKLIGLYLLARPFPDANQTMRIKLGP